MNRPDRGSPLLLTPDPPTLVPRSQQEIRRALHRAERLLQISQTLNATHDPDTLLASIIEMAAEVLDCEAAAILLYNETRHVLEFAASTGSDPDQLRQIPVPLEDSLAGKIFRKNRPLTITDVSAEAQHFDHVGQQVRFQTRSLLGVPMCINGTMTGVLEALNKRTGSFTEEDTHTLTIIASQAALAIRNANQVHALEQANEQLRQLEKLRSDFMAVASHELRTPLSIIIGYGEILQKEGDPAQQSHIDTVMQAGLHMRKVIETMTHMNMLRQGTTQLRRQTIALQTLIDDTLASVASEAEQQDHQVVAHVLTTPLLLHVDPKRMHLVLENVLKNAIYFTPRGGLITVRAHLQDSGMLIEVEDTGIGLHSTHQEQIFEEFFQVENHLTRAQGGLGLGLTIAREILHLHNGRIRARSEGPGTGTTIEIWIPTIPEDQQT